MADKWNWSPTGPPRADRDPYNVGADSKAWDLIYHEQRRRQQQAADQREQYERMQDMLKQAHAKKVLLAADAYLKEDGITIETTDGTKVKIPAGLLRVLATLVTMAELAKVVPADDREVGEAPAR